MRIVRIKEFTEEKEHVQWLVDSLLPEVGWTLFYGLRGIGKTTFAMQLCAALQEGQPFLGRKTRQCQTVYVQADSSEPEWREILKRVAPRSIGFTIVSVPDKALDNPKYIDYIRECMGKVKPGFVVFDSYYNLSARQINTTDALIPINIIKAMLGIDFPWMLVHHPTKQGDSYSGHNSLGGNCSNEWALLKTKLKVEKGRLVKDKELLLSKDEDGLWIPYTDMEMSEFEHSYSHLSRVRL